MSAAHWIKFALIVLASSQSIAIASIGNRFKKVVLVVFENSGYQKSIEQPDFSEFAKKGAVLTNLTAETHPSQGNYITMIAGSNFGIHSDNNVDLNNSHIGDLLEKAGKRWRVYAEDYPGNCFLGAVSGDYARKHNPFISFTNVSQNTSRCQNIESANRFDVDVASNNLPEFSMYIPNLKNDGHNTGVDYAGKYLTSKFGNFLSSSAIAKDVLLIITFDESQTSGPNKVLTILAGGSIIGGAQNNQTVDHSSLLKLVEEEFSLGSLNQADSTAPSLTGVWK